MNKSDHHWLQRAIYLSRQGMQSGKGGPFGCVIVKDGQIVGEGSNEVTSTNDPTAHAEVVAIRNACKQLGTFQLDGCVLYTSCEPCPMCLGAIYWARPDKVVYANTRHDAASISFDDEFIYKEILLPDQQRSIPFEHQPNEEALQVFKDWENLEDKVLY
jgi:tRNA(Arg) A34 adenosine deaminase TadA